LAGLYLDHNMSLHLVSPLEAIGHDVATARELNLTRIPDDAQLLAAVRAGRVLVTHDRGDFTLLHDAWLTWPAAFQVAFPPHPGIFVLDAAPHQILLETLDHFLAATPLTSLVSSLFWWHRHSGWRRREVGRGWEP